MWHTYHAPATLPAALDLLAQYGDRCRLIAGGTDLILEMERGVRRQEVLVDVSRIPGLDTIALRDGTLRLGPLVTHSQVVASGEAVAHAYPLASACRQVGAAQIRNRGTVAGNLITASPANDTITPLWAMDATVTLASRERGSRTLPFEQFFQGVRRTALAPDEMLIAIEAPALGPNERGVFLKLGLRQVQAISLVNVALVLDFADAGHSARSVVRRARIALGAVAPTIVRASAAEAYLAGKTLTEDTILEASRLAAAAARPISDIRAGAEYRRDMARVMAERGLRQLRDGDERREWSEPPVLLWGARTTRAGSPPPEARAPSGEIRFTLNGRPVTLQGAGGKTLLRALRENAGLTGTKEGCAEGECGACTVWLDGQAVMSCLVPAERAHGATVVTVEGLAGADGGLHPVQQAFVEAGAVQCGYCTPGFLMSAAKLLEETPEPTRAQIREALSGNLCRCTGYYKIVEAVEAAGRGR